MKIWCGKGATYYLRNQRETDGVGPASEFPGHAESRPRLVNMRGDTNA